MVDTFTKYERSRIMAAVKSKGTTPELVVRRLVRMLGFRFRGHDRSLPGSPDLVFAKMRKVILVHGCFWHRHRCAEGKSTPASNRKYWVAKFERNRRRDAKVRRLLRAAGWKALTVWECQTRTAGIDRLRARIAAFLDEAFGK